MTFNNSNMAFDTGKIRQIEQFILTDKFLPDDEGFYTGLGQKELTGEMNRLINEAAKDFIDVTKNNPSEKKYQDKIKLGLERFNIYYLQLDTEDREKVCDYFSYLMDIVELESSDGHLNRWMYGFDPNKLNPTGKGG